MKIGLCIIGCGRFATIFARSIQPLLTEIDLYFASRDLKQAQTYCNKFNGSGAFGSYQGAARSPDIQAMYICTPHNLHLEHTILAASSGKHVLVEKPIAHTVPAGRAIIATKEKHKINLMVAENYRFMPAVRLCKNLVDQGSIGRVRTIQIQQESPYKAIGWRKDPDMNGGGVFIDAGIHKVHFLRYILGEPASIYAVMPRTNKTANQAEDGLLFTAQWTSGEIGLIYHSWVASNLPYPHWVSLSAGSAPEDNASSKKRPYNSRVLNCC